MNPINMQELIGHIYKNTWYHIFDLADDVYDMVYDPTDNLLGILQGFCHTIVSNV
jgi:hypothetical protein